MIEFYIVTFVLLIVVHNYTATVYNVFSMVYICIKQCALVVMIVNPLINSWL